MKRNPKIRVYLDEIDVIQMCYAAIESHPNETFGLFLGESTLNTRGTKIFKIHFVQILQKGKRTPDTIQYKDREILVEAYTFNIIGDFHSHPNTEDVALPSRSDVIDIFKGYGNDSVFAILKMTASNKQGAYIHRKKNRISCLFGGFLIGIYFYSPKKELNGYRFNKPPQWHVNLITPRLIIRKKIHHRKVSIH